MQVAREGNTKVVRVSKPGQPSLLDPTVQPTAKVESMTIQEYEAELVYKEVMQVRTPLPPLTAAARRRCAQGTATAHPCRCPRAQFCFGAAVAVGFFHLYMGFLQPLALTGLFGPMTLVYKPMFKVHVLGEPAQGRLSRPYDGIEGTGGILETVMKTKKSLDQQSGQMTPAQEKKAAKKAARQAAKQARKVT